MVPKWTPRTAQADPSTSRPAPLPSSEEMTPRRDKVAVELDAQMIERTRAELGAGDESDAAVVERALNAYLLGRLLDTTQAKAGLSDEQAESLAYEELQAARRERGAA